MKGSLDSVSKHSLISRFFRSLVIIGLAAAATFTAALPIMAAESIVQEADGYFYINREPTNPTGNLSYYSVGDNFKITGGTVDYGLVVGTDVQPYCTYTITFKVDLSGEPLKFYDDSISLYSFTITDDLPTWEVIRSYQFNSASENYNEQVRYNWKRELVDNSYELYTYHFHTGEGYIDNISWGYNYVSLNLTAELSLYLQRTVSEITVDCVNDPSAEYYRYLTLGELTDSADKFEDASNALQEKEKQIMDLAGGIYDSVSSDFHNYLSDAKSFMSVATRSAASLGSAANVLTTSIYDPIMSSLPAEVAVLFTVIPMLSFIAWLFGISRGL